MGVHILPFDSYIIKLLLDSILKDTLIMYLNLVSEESGKPWA